MAMNPGAAVFEFGGYFLVPFGDQNHVKTDFGFFSNRKVFSRVCIQKQGFGFDFTGNPAGMIKQYSIQGIHFFQSPIPIKSIVN
jgi:hypothetical protein